jgi:hypothetical protein
VLGLPTPTRVNDGASPESVIPSHQDHWMTTFGSLKKHVCDWCLPQFDFHSPYLLWSLLVFRSFLCFNLTRRLWATFEFCQLHHTPCPCLPTIVCNFIVFNLLLVLGFSKRKGVSPTFKWRINLYSIMI